jgi:hypothetical protein
MKVFVFVLLMVLPDGEPKFYSQTVEVCPDVPQIEALFEDMMQQKEIIGWNAECFELATRDS